MLEFLKNLGTGIAFLSSFALLSAGVVYSGIGVYSWMIATYSVETIKFIGTVISLGGLILVVAYVLGVALREGIKYYK